MSLDFLMEPITAEEELSAGSKFDDTPVEPGDYSLEISGFTARTSKAGNVYMIVRLAHTGELSKKGSVFLNINNNEIGRKQFAQLIKAATGSSVGVGYTLVEPPSEKGTYEVRILRKGEDENQDITDELLGRSVVAALKIDSSREPARNAVRYIKNA